MQERIPTPEAAYTPADEQSVAAFIEMMCGRVNELLEPISSPGTGVPGYRW